MSSNDNSNIMRLDYNGVDMKPKQKEMPMDNEFLTRPKTMSDGSKEMTNESLKLLGAGSPYPTKNEK